ncbi:MAG TPA: PQQ-dependent sugar dehydrogenase [Actinomycetota bacterium]|nr:PQQ-dependent sugar dehydrogenase [Actinomycetota bacterium]
MRRSPRVLASLALAATCLAATATAAPADRKILQPGFVLTPFAETQGTPTSLAFSPDGQTLYVTDSTGGSVLAIDTTGLVTTFATDLRSPLGVVAGDDGSVYVADAEAAREGPYGLRSYGRVWRLRDTDDDGAADKRRVVLKDLPNGRHNTNGLAFGPDGMLYVTNGNSTDDGVEGGEAEVEPWSGSVVRVNPRAKNRSVTDLPRSALVAHGWRNVYDLAFSPVDATKLFVPMNGTDDARQGSTGENPADPDLEDSDDLLYLTDVNDRRVDDFAFPSCLYNLAERGNLKPYPNPNPDVIELFGPCRKRVVPRPVASFGLHPSANGLAFQTTDAWGDDYLGDLFVAEWGSLFGPPSGHKVVRVELNETGTKVTAQTDFVELDTPLDLTFHPEGDMYVADFSGTIFKITKAI